MIIVYYYHIDRHIEYSKEFTDVYEARAFYTKMKHVKYYITTYSCTTDYELKVMERIYK